MYEIILTENDKKVKTLYKYSREYDALYRFTNVSNKQIQYPKKQVYKNKVLVGKRQQKDIWENLFEFPKIELNELPSLAILNNSENAVFLKKMGITISEIPRFHVQFLTHLKIHACFIDVELKKEIQLECFEYVDMKTLKNLPFPKIIAAFIQTKNFHKQA